jgi:hypothetical protein
MQVYGNVARDVAADILGKQYGALSSGYKDAVTAAQNEQTIKNQLAQTLGTLSGTAYNQGVGGLDVLSKLGAQQQATEQAKLNYPMTALQNAATVMRGFTVPTTVSQTTTQPAGQGQMQLSPLSQIGAIVGSLGTMANQKISGLTGDQTLGQWLSGTLGKYIGGDNTTTTAGGSPVSPVVVDPNAPTSILDPNAPNTTGVNVDQSGNVTIPGITNTPSPYPDYSITPQ